MGEKETCWRWFRYAAEDVKAAQAELDRMADQGWELEELGLLCAKFRRAEQPRRCWVESSRWKSVRRKDENSRAEYLELCDEAGWELVEESRDLFYFRGKKGAHPAPIQTDGTVEWESVLRKALWDRAYNLIFLTLFWAVYFVVRFVGQGFHPWEVLLSNASMRMLLFLTAWTALDLVRGAYVLRYRGRCRRAARAGEDFPVPGRRGARVRGMLGLVSAALLAAVLLSALTGVGEEKRSGDLGGLMRYETVSVFARHTEYRRFNERDWLYAEDYDCRFPWLAEQICRDLVEDEGEEKRLDTHFHSAVIPQRADLPFDEAWTYAAGDRSGLILRQGSRTLRVECAASLEGLAGLEDLLDRLELEE